MTPTPPERPAAPAATPPRPPPPDATPAGPPGTAAPRRRWGWRALAAGAAVLFGLATLVEGGHTLFGGAAGRAEAGHYVPFVLAFNFAAGFVYVAAGGLLLARRPAARWLALGLAVSTAGVFAAFLAHVALGGAFERRTVVAMLLRTAFWSVQAAALPWLLRR